MTGSKAAAEILAGSERLPDGIPDADRMALADALGYTDSLCLTKCLADGVRQALSD